MKQKRKISIFIILFFMIVLLNSLNFGSNNPTSPQLKSASDNYEISDTDLRIDASYYYYYWWDLSSGSEILIYFETATEYQGLDFFICDQENFDLWTGGNSAYVHDLVENYHYLWDIFTAPSTERWYIIFYNSDISTSVTVDLLIDIEENIPIKNSEDHTDVGNFLTLESEEYYAVKLESLEKGTSITVEFETYFSTDGIDFFICTAEELANFHDGYTFISYENKYDLNQGSVNSFKVPKNGDWVVVFYAKEQADTISFLYSIDLEDPTFFGQYWYIFLIIALPVVGGGISVGLIVYNKRKRITGKTMLSGPLSDTSMYSQSSQQIPDDNQNLGVQQNFLICVKCGDTNPSSNSFCRNCGTDLSEHTR